MLKLLCRAKAKKLELARWQLAIATRGLDYVVAAEVILTKYNYSRKLKL